MDLWLILHPLIQYFGIELLSSKLVAKRAIDVNQNL